MSNYRQPWVRLELEGRPVKLQVLDPEAAFELERGILDMLGGRLAVALADPGSVLARVEGGVQERFGAQTFALAIADPDLGHLAAGQTLGVLARLLTEAAEGAKLDPGAIVETFERIIFERVRIEGRVIETWREWGAAGLGWRSRWAVLGAQIRQTWGPLWTRPDYTAGAERKVETYGVPRPAAPIAVQWAAALTAAGLAGSVVEVLEQWTPSRLLDIVDHAAQRAETSRRASEAAKKNGR